MKNLIVKAMIVATALFNLPSHACLPPPPAEVILKYRSFGGMPGPDGASSIEVTVNSYGEVASAATTGGWGKPVKTETKQLGQMGAQELYDIYTLMNQIEDNSELEIPNEPGCMDAPIIEYSIFKNGLTTKIYVVDACRVMLLKNQAERARAKELKQLLDKYVNLP